LEESQTKLPQPTELQRKYIKISLEVEDSNQQATAILQKAVQEASQKTKIGLAILMLTLVTSIASVLWAYRSISESEQKIAKVQAEAAIAKAQSEAEIAKAQNEVKIVKKQADAQIAKIKIENQNKVSEYSGSVSKVVGTQSKNGLVYIQVPSDAVKNRIQNLTTNLESGGYKAYIEVVGKSISPDKPRIRYFHKDQEGRVKKLQQDLIKINSEYKNFELQHISGFESKTRPEMMEIWFDKGAQ
jgi:hypothetical protein